MIQAKRISWIAQCLNTGFNVFGIVTIFTYNVWRRGDDLLLFYLWSIQFLGPLLFVAAVFLAPAGTFRVNAAPRWMLLFNLGVGAVPLILSVILVFRRLLTL